MCETEFTWTEFTNKIQSVAMGLLDAEFASLTALEVNKGWYDFWMDLSALVLFSNGTTLYEHGTTCRISVSHSSNYFSK